jgi:hypothetical protein
LPTATEIISQLLRLADAGPQNEQRDEGRRRQVAREADEGLEEGLDRLVRPHRDAQRQGQCRRDHEAADHAPHGHADVLGEAVLGQQHPARLEHRHRVGQEGLLHEAAEGRDGPDGEEHDEERQAERDSRARCDGRQRLHGRPRLT